MRFRHIQEWLAPPEFSQELEHAKDLRAHGTAEWLFDEQIYIDWVRLQSGPNMKVSKSNFGRSALWVQGGTYQYSRTPMLIL